MEERNNACSFSKLLKFIDHLQRKVEYNQADDNTCLRPYLGIQPFIEQYNTRPVTFYDCNNNLITINYNTGDDPTVEGESSVFRVEKVEDCYVIVTILIPNPNAEDDTRPFITTNQTAIINLNCVCAVKCLSDTIIDL